MPTGASPSPEKGNQHKESAEAKHLVVTQPEKFQGLLDTISLMDKVSERIGEDNSGDMGGTGGGSQGGRGDDDDAKSVRAEAIANMPDTPEIRQQLSAYIQKEIKSLRKQVRKQAFRASKPGSAHKLNELYAKIRRLNNLLSELMEASVDVIKRIFIRVFIDKQSI